ncbi:MAG TPA: acetate--CoA ligase family protein [Chloroflexota bacterium]|nr:acetate--CoA ligase family protein [Chloroflexota bacterium]
MSQPNLSGLEALFRPRSVAVVGASADPSKLGYTLVQNLVDYGFPGLILPVNPNASDILGHRVYPSLLETPEAPELVLVTVPSRAVVGVVEQAAQMGCQALVVLSSGFGEAGEEGRQAQERIAEIQQASGLRVLGPNCMGVYNIDANLNGTYFWQLPRVKGRISFVSQSGAYGGVFFEEIKARGIGVSKFVSIGNQLDVSHADMVIWLAGDPETAVIALFVEAIKDGPAFMDAVRAAGKPVVVFKAGRTHAGSRASASHTGSLSGEREVYEAAFKQAGAILARDTESFFDTAIALAAYEGRPLPATTRVAIMTISGGPCVIASDTCEEAGLEVPVLAPETQGRIRQLIPDFGASGNPVDMTPQVDPANIAGCVDAVSADPSVDGLIFINVGRDFPEFGTAFASASERLPVTAFVTSAPRVLEGLAGKVPNFPTPERAVHAYKALVQYARLRQRSAPGSQQHSVTPMTIEGSGVMDEHEAKRLLDRWGVPVVPETLVTGPGRHEFTPIRKLATHFGFPVVLKAIHRDIIHKTEMGAVAVGIPDIDRLKVAWEDMHARFPDAAWLIQPFLPGDVEVIVGARRDPVFGPVVVFGTGGVMTELYHDVALRVAPLSQADALEMIKETKAAELMRGFRGLPVHDPREVAAVIVKVGQLMLGQPSVLELDVNPLLLTEKGPIAVDAMAVIE